MKQFYAVSSPLFAILGKAEMTQTIRQRQALRHLRSVPAVEPIVQHTRSVVGSENNEISRATSILYTMERKHSGASLTIEQARDVIAWAAAR